MAVLEARGLEKTYASGTRALDGVSIAVEQGTVFGLLGPNGAGKTTFVKIVATQLLPTGGSATVLGHDVVSEPREVRSHIAAVPQEGRPLSLQTPYEHLLTYLVARGLPVADARRRAKDALTALNLDPYRDTICANLSGGLRQRVLVAMAMSTDAELLILDEPTIGLDPVARVDVWNLVRDYVAKGRTILLTTHYMDEAEALSDRLAIVNKGRVIAAGTPAEIRGRLRATHVVIVKAKEDIEALHKFGRVLRAGASLRILTDREGASSLSAWCVERNLEVSVRQVSVEDVFISEVGAGVDSEPA
ncbi:MAG TPA: ABC transporter ATP-binding protein [Thermoplasmata archaeon]|nr:ABC transporter ATP-binding protein [Thermoplasmata archaeon]